MSAEVPIDQPPLRLSPQMVDTAAQLKLTDSQARAAELSLLSDVARAIRDRSTGQTGWLSGTQQRPLDRSYYELGVLSAIDARRKGTVGRLLGQREDGHYLLREADSIMDGLAGQRADITAKATGWSDDDAQRMTQVVQAEVGGLPSHMRDTMCGSYADLGLQNKDWRTRAKEAGGEVITTIGGYGAIDISATGVGIAANTINKVVGPLHANSAGFGISSGVLGVGTAAYGVGLYVDGMAAVNSARERGVSPNVGATRGLRWAQRRTASRKIQNAVGLAGSLIPNAVAEIIHAPDDGISTAVGGVPALLLTVGVENFTAGVGLLAHAKLTPRNGEGRLSQRIRTIFPLRGRSSRSVNSSGENL